MPRRSSRRVSPGWSEAVAGKTYFAPPERLDAEQSLELSRSLQVYPELRLVLEVVPECAAILSEHRQILMANDSLLGLLSAEDIMEIRGCRPGEALGCIHALEAPSGCGTGENCRYCGAAAAILEALETGKKATHECRVTAESGNETVWLDLQVSANPVTYGGNRLVVLTMVDTSDAKRRRKLEQIFFHDVLNSAAAMHGLIELMNEYDEREIKDELATLTGLSRRLIEEISAQRDLAAAESGELTARVEEVDANALLDDAVSLFSRGRLAAGKDLLVRKPDVSLQLLSDRHLLLRVITNMLKNALEATRGGGMVTAGAERTPGDRKSVV